MSQKKFGATIRTLREEQQISLRKFAGKVGISPTYLSKIERDEFPPPGEDTVKTIAEALGQDPDEFCARQAISVPTNSPRLPSTLRK